jgi:hypothetical protein
MPVTNYVKVSCSVQRPSDYASEFGLDYARQCKRLSEISPSRQYRMDGSLSWIIPFNSDGLDDVPDSITKESEEIRANVASVVDNATISIYKPLRKSYLPQVGDFGI